MYVCTRGSCAILLAHPCQRVITAVQAAGRNMPQIRIQRRSCVSRGFTLQIAMVVPFAAHANTGDRWDDRRGRAHLVGASFVPRYVRARPHGCLFSGRTSRSRPARDTCREVCQALPGPGARLPCRSYEKVGDVKLRYIAYITLQTPPRSLLVSAVLNGFPL